MNTRFTPEFIAKQREIIQAATDEKWFVAKNPEIEMDWEYGDRPVGGYTGRDIYDRDIGVYCRMAIDVDDRTEVEYETIAAPWNEADAECIAEAHNNYPAALDEIEQLQAVVLDQQKKNAALLEVCKTILDEAENHLHTAIAKVSTFKN
jgi:hypothetical protein